MKNNKEEPKDFSDIVKMLKEKERAKQASEIIKLQTQLLDKNKVEDFKEIEDAENKEYIAYIKKAVQEHTKFVFDDKDKQWNRFIIRYSKVLNDMNVYTRKLAVGLATIGLLSWIMAYIVFKPLTYTVFMQGYGTHGFQFLSYYILMILIIPYIVTYYSLRKEIDIKRIFFRNIRSLKAKDIFMLVTALGIAILWSSLQELLIKINVS